jgi:hypothetical protein
MRKALFLAAIFAVGIAFALTPEEKEAQEKARAEAKASEEAWKALRKEAEDLAQKDFKGGFADYWHDHIDAARALLDASLTNAVFRNRERIEIFRQMAQYRLEATRDEAGALAEVERAFALPGLSDDDRALAESRRADLRRLMGLDPEPEKHEPTEEERLADLAGHELGTGAWNRAFDGYARFCAEKRGAAFFRERVPAKFAEALAADAKTPCARTAFDVAAWQVRRGEADPGFKDPAFGEWLLGWIDTLPAENRPDAVRLFEYADSFRGHDLDARKEAYAKAVVERAKDEANRVPPRTLENARKFLAFRKASGGPGRAIDACREWLRETGKADDKVELAKLLAWQAREFLSRGDEKGARAIWKEREKIVPPRKPVAFACPWWGDAPHDIRGIVESDFYRKGPKNLLSQRYGDNLEFLIGTDSALTGREMTTDDGKPFRPSELFAFCDPYGVRLLLRQFLDNMDDIRAGLARPPGVEAFVAMGVDDPYRCLLVGTAEDAETYDGFTTQYDNGTGYRVTREDRGTVRCRSLYLDDGVATLVEIPWAAAFASMPPATPAWYVECLNWAHGGRSLGGSVSVHNRSSFAEMRFEGVDAAAVLRIERMLLPKAKAVFDASLAAGRNGPAEVWADPELGDQAFYLAKVKPLVDAIRPYADRIKPGMTDEDVADIYAHAGRAMLNIDHDIARLRREWLAERLTED